METAGEGSYSEAEIREEGRKVKHLRRLVDFSLALIAQTDIAFDEAQRLVQAVRLKAYDLFPGKEETFELIYTPRFHRLLAEKFKLQ